MILYKSEKTNKFSLTIEEISNFCTNYMIDAAYEVLFREKKREYERAKSIEDFFKRKGIAVKEIVDRQQTLTFRCSPADIKHLDGAFERINQFSPYNFNQKEIFLALVYLTSVTLMKEKYIFTKYLKKVSTQDPKLTEKKIYKFQNSRTVVLFESMYKFIENLFPDKDYSSGDIFRAMIIYSKEATPRDIAYFIKFTRDFDKNSD
jgi:hypothetical protein